MASSIGSQFVASSLDRNVNNERLYEPCNKEKVEVNRDCGHVCDYADGPPLLKRLCTRSCSLVGKKLSSFGGSLLT